MSNIRVLGPYELSQSKNYVANLMNCSQLSLSKVSDFRVFSYMIHCLIYQRWNNATGGKEWPSEAAAKIINQITVFQSNLLSGKPLSPGEQHCLIGLYFELNKLLRHVTI
jgi:hypothetical protein